MWALKLITARFNKEEYQYFILLRCLAFCYSDEDLSLMKIVVNYPGGRVNGRSSQVLLKRSKPELEVNMARTG